MTHRAKPWPSVCSLVPSAKLPRHKATNRMSRRCLDWIRTGTKRHGDARATALGHSHGAFEPRPTPKPCPKVRWLAPNDETFRRPFSFGHMRETLDRAEGCFWPNSEMARDRFR